MRFFCTYFDAHYLPRGLALYQSLELHVPQFKLWVLCMDESSYNTLERLALPRLHPILLSNFEHGDAALLAAKENRSQIEYYFTCTPSLPLYVFRTEPAVDLVTYLDADLFFFDNPEALFDELGQGSVSITAHRFPAALRNRERYGIYNVGWLSFRRDARGLNCLNWWRERCLEWCYDREEGGRFADQKYLDDWTTRFSGVVVLQHKGANLAPWNVENYRLRPDGQTGVKVDANPLIFFHFHALKKIGRWTYDPGWIEYGVRPSKILRSRVYVPYLRTLLTLSRRMPRVVDGQSFSNSSRLWSSQAETRSPPRRIVGRLRQLRSNLGSIVAGRLLFLPGG